MKGRFALGSFIFLSRSQPLGFQKWKDNKLHQKLVLNKLMKGSSLQENAMVHIAYILTQFGALVQVVFFCN